MPVAFAIAFAIAGATPMMQGSAIPRALPLTPERVLNGLLEHAG